MIVVSILLAFILANHPVGEPKLEKSPVWKECCEDFDCKISKVSYLSTRATQTLMMFKGDTAWIDNDKFKLSPSDHVWVCWVDLPPDGIFENENIRCILRPDKIPLI